MHTYIEVVFKALTAEVSDMLVASLSEHQYDGFEERGAELRAYVKEENYDPALLEQLASGYAVSFDVKPVKEENWNAMWESGFDPVIFNGFAGIRAGFHQPLLQVKHEIIITPKMSFGTGHHATTRMMIGQMSEIAFTGKSVFDFGTGTGILAILACKMGASEILAIDNDPWSISNAQENALNNHCGSIRIIESGSADQQGQFDIILANIIKTVIVENMDKLVKQLKKGGLLLVSGLMPEDESDILECAKKRSLIVDKKMRESGWISLRFSLK